MQINDIKLPASKLVKDQKKTWAAQWTDERGDRYSLKATMEQFKKAEQNGRKAGQCELGPKGWFKAAHVARDTEEIYQWLVRDNNRRIGSGLPPFLPSYDLAQAIAERP